MTVKPEDLTDAGLDDSTVPNDRRAYWWTPPMEPENLRDQDIYEEMAKLTSENRADAVDECEMALGIVGRWPDGMYDCRIGRRFGVFEARQRVCAHINARKEKP